MHEEDKTLNFTTQNSILHYGRKGMKWGENIFEDDEPINKQYQYYKEGKFWSPHMAKTYAQNKAAYAYGKAVYKTSRAKNAIKNSKVGKAYSKWDQDMSDMMDQHIANKQAKNRDPEQQEKINKMNSVSDETREQVRQVTSNLSELEKYINAYKQGIDSFDPSDKKKREAFAQKFIDKYGSKIREFVISANDGMDALENSGLEGFQNNKLEFSIKGKKGIDIMANLEKSVSSNQDQLKRKAKNVVYGDYK